MLSIVFEKKNKDTTFFTLFTIDCLFVYLSFLVMVFLVCFWFLSLNVSLMFFASLVNVYFYMNNKHLDYAFVHSTSLTLSMKWEFGKYRKLMYISRCHIQGLYCILISILTQLCLKTSIINGSKSQDSEFKEKNHTARLMHIDLIVFFHQYN